MRLLILISFIFVFLQSRLFCQEMNLTPSLSNIVDIGNGSFGIIIGKIDENTLSFVTVGDETEDFFSGISVKFHGLAFEGTGKLIKSFTFGKYTLALYQCENPDRSYWRPAHYNFFPSNSSSYRSFLDNGKSDNQWSYYREPIILIHLADGIATLRMGNHALFSRGMPVINSNGSIVGIIADKQDHDKHLIFDAIDFSIIERLFLLH